MQKCRIVEILKCRNVERKEKIDMQNVEMQKVINVEKKVENLKN